MTKTYKRAFLRISLDILSQEFLRLPKGLRIKHVLSSDREDLNRESFTVLLEGGGLPELEGCFQIPDVELRLNEVDGEVLFGGLWQWNDKEGKSVRIDKPI